MASKSNNLHYVALTGIGLGPEELAKVTEPFTQAGTRFIVTLPQNLSLS